MSKPTTEELLNEAVGDAHTIYWIRDSVGDASVLDFVIEFFNPEGGSLGIFSGLLQKWELEDDEDEEDVDGDARLIAAAPNMLAALKALDTICMDGLVSVCPRTGLRKELHFREIIDAAINKAEGECEHGHPPQNCILCEDEQEREVSNVSINNM